MVPNDGIIDSPGPRPPANALASVCRVRYGLRISRFGSSSRVDARLYAAGATAKTTNLYVAVAVVTSRNSSLIVLLKDDGGPSLSQNVACYSGYEDHHGRLS